MRAIQRRQQEKVEFCGGRNRISRLYSTGRAHQWRGPAIQTEILATNQKHPEFEAELFHPDVAQYDGMRGPLQ